MSTRRQFLTTAIGSSAVLSFGGVAPGVFCETALAGTRESTGRVLVVVQMSGGNDGLNTVVPHSHDVYLKNRKRLRISKPDALAITKDHGLHPAMTGFAELLEAGQLGIVPSVGYPNPNQSHFESMDIWHTCRRKNEARKEGWLGRLLEAAKAESSLVGMHIGDGKQPLALGARNLRLPSVQSLERFRLKTEGNQQLGKVLEKALAIDQGSSDNDLLNFLSGSTQSAVAADKRLKNLRTDGDDAKGFPQTALGRKLATVSKLIKAEMPTRLYYVTIDGFDTHARQAGAHEGLLRQLSGAITALVKDLNSAGHGERVLVMSFSEFGRRVAENASEGTDHGTAGPMFLAGKVARSGFLGPHSDLTKLRQGDLRHRTDFRSVYASIVQDWFGYDDAKSIVGGYFKPVPILKRKRS